MKLNTVHTVPQDVSLTEIIHRLDDVIVGLQNWARQADRDVAAERLVKVAVTRRTSKKKPAESSPAIKQALSTEGSLDSKNGWHAFRDHGQFGSYPSHDDKGDESAP